MIYLSFIVLPGWVQEPCQAEQAYIQGDDPGKQLRERRVLALHHHITSSIGIDDSEGDNEYGE
ncbi:MAG: hypothetical protein SD837_08050 [Candidatus Electrothrix scaldis]|nr:MAG: hypothetical protein SD837_08050 [Candidatus Electrothrix sp. GW3-3]